MLGAEFKESKSFTTPVVASKNGIIPFGDPEDYKDLTQEEKEELTQKMIGQHQMWVMRTPL